MSEPRTLLFCDWCNLLSRKESENGYCQKCFESKLKKFIEASAYDSLKADAEKLVEALQQVYELQMHPAGVFSFVEEWRAKYGESK